MMFQMLVSAVLALLCTQLHVTHGQQQPPPQQPGQLGPCSRGLEQELPVQCLQSNGIDYNGTLFIISGNRTGALPAGMTYSSFLDLMCSVGKQDQVVPCILQLMQKWNKTQCQQQDRITMLVRGRQLLAFMEGFCGDPCEQAAMQTLIQCFGAVEVDPTSILNQNATIITDKFSFVGNDSASATKFCNSRQKLFTCLSPLATQCPKIMERLYTLGVDLEGMERATKVLCDDLDSPSSPALRQCDQEVGLLFQQVQEERFITGKTKPSQYQGRLCQTKLSKVDCELKKFRDSCGAESTDMVSTYECTSIPKPCREGSETLRVYESICKKVTTPAPTVTVRPTPPKKIENPDTGRGDDGDYNSRGSMGAGGGAMAVVGEALRVLVCSAVVVVMGLRM
ncbi:uncharacterized protein LOC143287196 [Babylonia areolata]|uniref:uncharacterized protein LOC143287196 n=1 Tax=Babylonia areolata TaxID=304850 RepID=UPI003FD2FE7F